MENYGPNGQGPRGQYDYSSTALWYQAERTPPFAQLRDVKYTGGADPDGAPEVFEYDTAIFPDIDGENLRTYGLGVTFAHQAELLMADAINVGTAKVVTDAHRSYEFDRERAVDFGTVKAGQQLGTFILQVDTETVYNLHLYTAPESGCADLTLKRAGRLLPIKSHDQPHVLQPESLYLAKGEHQMSLVAVTAGHAVFDCLQLEPAPRFVQAIECEELTIVGSSSDMEKPRPSDPITGVSAGRVLEFDARQDGQSIVVDLGKRPTEPYVLGVRPMLSPNGAIIQAFVADKPLGPPFDLYATELQLGPTVLPLGPVPRDVKAIEIRVVGKNASSQGRQVQLDYMRWEPEILGPETAAGIWAQVVGTRGCRYEPQNLGSSYSGGHQFWVQPSSSQAWVDIAIEVPTARTYEFGAKYTKSWDYARIQAFVDGQPLGPVVDTFAESVVPGETTMLGKLELTAGRHVVRFQAVGKNPQSKGFLMGIDHVSVK